MRFAMINPKAVEGTRLPRSRRTHARHLRTAVILGAGLLILTLTNTAEAVFVTDDARIADYGQIEGETWFDFLPKGGRVLPVYNFLFNVVPFELARVRRLGGGSVGTRMTASPS